MRRNNKPKTQDELKLEKKIRRDYERRRRWTYKFNEDSNSLELESSAYSRQRPLLHVRRSRMIKPDD